MNIGTMLLRALAYSGDLAAPLAREAVDVALDRGLRLLADHRPSRIVAREDYMRRAYLFGRMGHRFPEDARAVLGSLGATAYLHEIRSADAGRSHHSHPWEWAISIVLAGSYIEEIVTADGSIVERRREPGSVAVINAGSFHRIAEIGAPRVWTLFIAGPRTLDRAWFFRRPDGSIVHERDYHHNLEAERRAEDAWLENRYTAAPGADIRHGDIVALDHDGHVHPIERPRDSTPVSGSARESSRGVECAGGWPPVEWTVLDAHGKETIERATCKYGDSAAAARANGWGPGTVLVGDEGYGPDAIVVDFLGKRALIATHLAKWRDGRWQAGRCVSPETSWTLSSRDWRRATQEELEAIQGLIEVES